VEGFDRIYQIADGRMREEEIHSWDVLDSVHF
jgi:hypothetical protein